MHARNLSPRAEARRRSGAFRPRIELLETRNAPGEVLSLAALSLGGLGLELFSDQASEHGPTERERSQERLRLLNSAAVQSAFTTQVVRGITPSVAPAEVSAAVTALPRSSGTASAEANLLLDAAQSVTPAGGFENQAEADASDRGNGMDMRWSGQLQALLQQSQVGLPTPPAGRESAAALQVYAAIQPTGLGGVRGGADGITIIVNGDTNRDGIADDSDLEGRNDWTQTLGAIYAVNFDDDNGDRQPDAVDWNDQGRPFNENKVIESDEDLYDLAPLRIMAFGQGLTETMRVYLRANTLEDAQSIHVFPYYGAGATSILGGIGNRAVGGVAEATEADITDWISRDYEVYFGVEGLLFRETNTAAAQAHRRFDGYVDLTLEVRDSDVVVGSDTVRMKVAPWIMSHHMEPSMEAWTGDYAASNLAYRRTASADPGYVGFDYSGQLQEVTGTDRGTQWFQDHGEFGFTGFPGGPKTWVFFRLPYFRGTGVAQPNWPKTRILRPDVGTFQIGVSHGAGAGDYGGNLEITHPTATNAHGRIILGSTGSTALRTFLQAQEVQTPTSVNTGWLIVSHSDETFMFTQNYNEVVVASPQTAYDLMDAVPEEERGSSVFFAKGANPVSGTSSLDAAANEIYTGMDHTTGTQWGWIRIFDSSATGSGAGGQIARITARGNGYVDIGTVYNTSSNVIGAGTTPSAMRWALTTNPPLRTGWYNIPRQGDRFVLLQDTQHWGSGASAPAAITVHEVLADTAFRNFSLTNVQNMINGQMTSLDAAAGGAGSLNFVPLPTLFFGTPSGAGVGSRSGVAMTPGLANVVPLNTELYFPRQYGFRDASGQDVFETYTRSLLPSSLFVDDWNLYHRLLGEVHCGMVVRSDHWYPDWWNYE